MSKRNPPSKREKRRRMMMMKRVKHTQWRITLIARTFTRSPA
jgi:hypothetical protein